MRLLRLTAEGDVHLTRNYLDNAVPPYAILSHTWDDEDQEVSFEDISNRSGQDKAGLRKLKFIGERAKKDGLDYFWVDTCCIKRSSDAELSEAINSMFYWYSQARKCYVYLSDVAFEPETLPDVYTEVPSDDAFRRSRWFKRGWTLQELLAPSIVEFYSQEGCKLGDRQTRKQEVHEITGIPISALEGCDLSIYSVQERLNWAEHRETTREEDWVYSLFGILDVSLPVIYGERRPKALRRLKLYLHEQERTIQSRTSVLSLVDRTRDAFLSSGDSESQRNLAFVYRCLAEQDGLLRHLARTIEEQAETSMSRRVGWSDCTTDLPDHCSCHHALSQSRSDRTNILFRCAAHFSHDHSQSSHDKLSRLFAGCPSHCLESQTAYRPEILRTTDMHTNPLRVLATQQIRASNSITRTYYMLYAGEGRQLQRLILTVTYKKFRGAGGIREITSPDAGDNELVVKHLPNKVHDSINEVLLQCQTLEDLTSLAMDCAEDEKGVLVPQVPYVQPSKDLCALVDRDHLEVSHCIDLLGLRKISESRIDVKSQLSYSSCFAVLLDGLPCIQRMLSFTKRGEKSHNGLRGFIDDLKLYSQLRECPGITRLIGVVVDRSFSTPKGFLLEAPMYYRLNHKLHVANENGFTIPWSVRLLWAVQIARAIAYVHAKGLILGALSARQIGLSRDGSAVLTNLLTSEATINLPQAGELAPELRPGSGDSSSQVFTDRTDVFQFGLILWLLAEHKGNVLGARCSRYGCTAWPMYKCTASHSDPVELPPCIRLDVPPSIFDIINGCRSATPRERPLARDIVDDLSLLSQERVVPGYVIHFMDTHPDVLAVFAAHCDNCGRMAGPLHYHCYICVRGDFDLCADCVALGVHCWVEEHTLAKRVFRDGRYVSDAG